MTITGGLKMVDQTKTDITFVLDRSGSMVSVENEAISGVNRILEDQRALGLDVRVTLNLFNDEFKTIYSGRPISDAPNLTLADFSPFGFTALHDAIGKSIFETGKRLADTPEVDRPGKVIFVIVTDGAENSSMKYKGPQLAEMIKHQKEKYLWDFIFLGANQDASLVGSSLNIGTTLSTSASRAGTAQAYASTSTLLLNKALAPDATASMSVSYTVQDQQAQVALGAPFAQQSRVGTILPNGNYVPFGAPNT
jgi:hypothetical protein